MSLPTAVKDDLAELVQLASQVTEAHTAAIFLPTYLLNPRLSASTSVPNGATVKGKVSRLNTKDAIPLKQVVESGVDAKNGSIELVAVHSYSKLARDARIQSGAGLLGWVAEQGRPIYLSPCDLPNHSLALYADNEAVKSFAAIPIDCAETDPSQELTLHGVLMCDSLKNDAFSSATIKMLEQMAKLCKQLLVWSSRANRSDHVESSWEVFKQKTAQLGDAIGSNSVDLLKIHIRSFQELEASAGVSEAIKQSEQFLRLIQQALPPHFPIMRLPSGEIIVSLDNMMSTFFQQKLQNLAAHLNNPTKPLVISIERYHSIVDNHGRCDFDKSFHQKPLCKNPSSLGGARA